jgi:hypothetical protein
MINYWHNFQWKVVSQQLDLLGCDYRIKWTDAAVLQTGSFRMTSVFPVRANYKSTSSSVSLLLIHAAVCCSLSSCTCRQHSLLKGLSLALRVNSQFIARTALPHLIITMSSGWAIITCLTASCSVCLRHRTALLDNVSMLSSLISRSTCQAPRLLPSVHPSCFYFEALLNLI